MFFSGYHILIDEFFDEQGGYYLKVPVKKHKWNARFVKTLRNALGVSISPEERYYLSYNLYFLTLVFLDNQRLHFFVRGLQTDFVAFFLKPLYKHLTFDDAGHYFTIFYNLLRSHNNDIFIADTIVYHAVAFDFEQEMVSIDKSIYPYKFLHLKRHHGTSGRYFSEKRQTGHFY